MKTIACSILTLLLVSSGFSMNKMIPKRSSVETPSVSGTANAPSTVITAPQASYNAPYQMVSKYPDVYATASFLYWKPFEDGTTTYTLYIQNKSTPTVSSLTEFWDIGSFDFEYKPAFKVGLGMHFPRDNWDLYAEYTWYHNTFNDYFTFTGPDPSLTGPVAHVQLFPTFSFHNYDYKELLHPSSMHSKLDMDFDWVDLELGRNYYVGKSLTFHSHLGLRAAFLDQKISQFPVLTQAGFIGPIGPVPHDSNVSSAIFQKTESWGIRPRAGLDMDFFLCRTLKVFGDIAASLLFTKYELTATQTGNFETDFLAQGVNATVHQKNLSPLRPNLEMGLGLKWGGTFFCERYFLELAAGYDFLMFWNQNMFRISNQSHDANLAAASIMSLDKDLYLHGLNVSLQFDF